MAELPGDDLKCKAQGELCFDNDEKNSIRVLERALEEEHAARATLYLELEKERSVAANAADEAMTVFLRLQEEKASIETEAKMNFKRESWSGVGAHQRFSHCSSVAADHAVSF
ncbi:hypothetical protein NC652_003256 [Populus alba x Populus x berolinensis]|uniref:GTD-binding domain-containing protein n=2 Tax=Populus TaxID=3689 RepID=A0A4U5QHI7_POPAL|nr:hypothetical protein NC652_003256 [Populus alba x Populus x berolinensis]KAJ7013632.1 hypothetical protein NC653_003322 [Populus alba x Populus x berolinensis]TKS08015.1 hypothetical protein D5086_0000106650 [Populus alba]